MAELALYCPKCHAVMVSILRDGIVVEQCAACRGIFVSEPELGRIFEGAATGGVSPLVSSGYGYPEQAYEGRHRRI